MALFDKALAEMGDRLTADPQPFGAYADEAGYPTARTAKAISIQTLDGLAPELARAGVMVFRLGGKPGLKGTCFALARHTGSWNDYFFQDEELFARCKSQPLIADREGLRIFDILPKSTETSLVNLAVASGVMAAALRIDSSSKTLVNATAQGAYSFMVRPHEDLDVCWFHNCGQVEIDGAFVARRNGKETLFLVEAKVSSNFESLAKHKIAYPMLAVAELRALELDIVGVYLRVLRKPGGVEFYVAECHFTSAERELSSLKPVNVGAYSLQPIA